MAAARIGKADRVVRTVKPAAVDAIDSMSGMDLYGEMIRQRRLNRKLTSGLTIAGIVCAVLAVIAIAALAMRADAFKVAVDPVGRAYPIETMTTDDPPDAKVTLFVRDCINGVLNGTFHDYDETIGKTISECFTTGGEVAVASVIEPFLDQMKANKTNVASQFVVLPLMRGKTGSKFANRKFTVQGEVAVGFRGQNTNSRPLTYAFEASVVRVPYWSSVQGIRLESIRMKPSA